jgi:hypothetical protein
MSENGYSANLTEKQWELDSIYNNFLRNFRNLELDQNLRVYREFGPLIAARRPKREPLAGPFLACLSTNDTETRQPPL